MRPATRSGKSASDIWTYCHKSIFPEAQTDRRGRDEIELGELGVEVGGDYRPLFHARRQLVLSEGRVFKWHTTEVSSDGGSLN